MSCFVFVFFFCFSVHRLTHALCIATINQTDQCHCVYITLLLARQIQAIITMYYIELYMGKFRTNNQANITMSSTSLLYTLTFFSRKTMCSFLSQKTFCSNPTQKSTGEKKKTDPSPRPVTETKRLNGDFPVVPGTMEFHLQCQLRGQLGSFGTKAISS